MRMMLIFLCLCLLAGCGSFATPGEVGPQGPPGADGVNGAEGPQGPPGVGYANGSRLLVRGIAYEDGARMPLRLFDSELGVSCELRTASDGSSRCLPTDTSLIRYLDPACEELAVTQSACAPAPKFASQVLPAASACGTTYDGDDAVVIVRPVGEPIDGPTTVYTKNLLKGTCDQLVEVPAGAWFELGPSLAPEEFVSGSVQVL